MDKPCWCGQSHSSNDVAERMQDHFIWRLYESTPLREKPQPPDWWPHQRKLKPGGGGVLMPVAEFLMALGVLAGVAVVLVGLIWLLPDA